MTLASVIVTKADVDKLREFVKLPENKAWLGRVSRFYSSLESTPAVTEIDKVQRLGTELKSISEQATALLKAANDGCDESDAEMLNKLSLKLMERVLKSVSPELMAAAGFGGMQ